MAADSAAVEARTCLVAHDLFVKGKTFLSNVQVGGIAADISYTQGNSLLSFEILTCRSTDLSY